MQRQVGLGFEPGPSSPSALVPHRQGDCRSWEPGAPQEVALFVLGPGRCCERRGHPRSPAQCPWTRGLTRFEAERRAVSEDGGLGKHDAFRGEQINLLGSEGRSVEKRRPWGDGGAHSPSPAQGFILRTEGALRERQSGGGGRIGTWGGEGPATESPRERLPRARTAWGRGKEQVGPWGGGGGGLRRSLPLRAQGRLWAVSDVRRRPPSGLISSGGERHFLGSPSDSICISCGPGRASVLDQKDRRLGEGEAGGRWAENLETPLFSPWWLQGPLLPLFVKGGNRGGAIPLPLPPKSPEPLSPSTGPSSLPCTWRALPGRRTGAHSTGSPASGDVSVHCACLLPPPAWPAPGVRPLCRAAALHFLVWDSCSDSPNTGPSAQTCPAPHRTSASCEQWDHVSLDSQLLLSAEHSPSTAVWTVPRNGQGSPVRKGGPGTKRAGFESQLRCLLAV